jgi:uncharacterized membrane protein
VIVVDENLNLKTKTWILLMRCGAKVGCHQMHERSFFFGDYQFPVCARCTGIYIGGVIGIFFAFLFKFNFIILSICTALSVLAMGTDGLLQLKKVLMSNNPRRIITGLLFGFFFFFFVVRVVLLLVDSIH